VILLSSLWMRARTTSSPTLWNEGATGAHASGSQTGTEGEPEPVLRFEGLEIHLLKNLSNVKTNRSISLPTEYRLLEAMATNPGKLLTHTWLFQKVWGPGYGTESNYLRLFVRQLRRKLADTPSTPRGLRPNQGWATGGCPSPEAEAEHRLPIRGASIRIESELISL
jgi:DNA-binding response OmpR family regulator